MLKLIALQKRQTALQAKMKALRSKRENLRGQEQSLAEQLEAMPDTATAEELRSINEQVETNAAEQTATDDEIIATQDELDEVAEKIEEAQRSAGAAGAQRSAGPAPAPRAAAPAVTAEGGTDFRSRSQCFATRTARDSFFAQDDVKDFLQRVRGLSGQKRSVTGAELTIPEVVLDLIRDNLHRYSKLLRKVRLRPVNGTARQPIVGEIPEGVWMEMKGALNNLEFNINELEVDGFKVGGIMILDNYVLEDSDIALGEEVLYMLGQAIGYALDKAIVYGLGPASKMPVGIVTRLAATTQPAWWGPNQGDFTDLHSANVMKLDLGGASGVNFFTPFVAALGKAKANYASQGTFWVMNHKTHMDLITRALAFNAAGSLVSGLGNAMPVESGEIIELEFMPDYEVAGGYGELYLLAERSGGKFGFSDLPLYIQDKTVFKGTARYDGMPIRGEGFVVINYNNTDVTTVVDFAKDYANTAMNVLICTAAAHASTSGATVVTVSGSLSETPALKYSVRYGGAIAVGEKPKGDWTALTSGTTAITATAGAPITVVELDSAGRVVSSGMVNSVPKT